tara:strand:+ start:52830 stop:54005 length:1176 start_codon:yes stop_codon:yes gene_type:complete
VKVIPFNAIRPIRDKANLFASRSYLTYSNKTIAEKINNNPYTFLHIINPDFNLENKLFGREKFKHVKKKFQEFYNNNILISDNEDCYYLYEQSYNSTSYIGIVGLVSSDDYTNNNIKKHENTIYSKEKMFVEYLEETRFQADAILLAHKKNNNLKIIYQNIKKIRPEYEFTTTDKVLHKLWKISNKKIIDQITQEFKNIDKTYIADGHHRCASTSKLKNKTNIMSLLISEEQLHVSSFNRLVKTNITDFELFNKIDEKFYINKTILDIPIKQNEIIMFKSNQKYLLQPKKDSYIDNEICRLGVSILFNNILFPILNIKDERKTDKMEFLPNNTDFAEVKNKINSKSFDIAFILKPITINEIKKVADKNKYMPPKSTYIEPKLRSGLTIYKF